MIYVLFMNEEIQEKSITNETIVKNLMMIKMIWAKVYYHYVTNLFKKLKFLLTLFSFVILN